MTVNVNKQWFLDRMKDQGLSLSQVAREIGIDKSALSRALDGKRQIKSLEIGKIATNLGATREEVIDHLEGIANNVAAGKEVRQRNGSQTVTIPSGHSGAVGERRPLHPGIGFMKGLIKIEPGFDAAGPFSDESWEDGYLGEDRLAGGNVKKVQK